MILHRFSLVFVVQANPNTAQLSPAQPKKHQELPVGSNENQVLMQTPCSYSQGERKWTRTTQRRNELERRENYSKEGTPRRPEGRSVWGGVTIYIYIQAYIEVFIALSMYDLSLHLKFLLSRTLFQMIFHDFIWKSSEVFASQSIGS